MIIENDIFELRERLAMQEQIASELNAQLRELRLEIARLRGEGEMLIDGEKPVLEVGR